MQILIRSLVLSLLTGFSCQLFFKTVLAERRKWPRRVCHTEILAYTAGFMLIAVTPIPPYLLQPVRVIIVLFLIAQFYYRTGVLRNLLAAVLFCGIYWLIFVILLAAVYLLPLPESRAVYDGMEVMAELRLLSLVLFFRLIFRKRPRHFSGLRWEKFGFIPVLVMIVLMAVSMLVSNGNTVENYIRFTVVFGMAVLCVCIVYFAVWRLEKEEELRLMQLSGERVRNQMEMYRGMQKSYEQQRRLLHDYKNQLQSIQGMLERGGTEEALHYLSGLTGNLKRSVDLINTNHMVVNVVLNQKYQDALEKNIMMTMSVNNLSELAIGEEEIVTLLVNLLDNAIEACEKLTENRVIQFKMTLEEEMLVLSVRNPVKEPVRINDGRPLTAKRDQDRHGIGLLNVDAVIRKYDGTSVIKCEDGWFYFAAMIPPACRERSS